MRNHGGSGDYVEGERVFAPPAGTLDPDWVAGVVLDRMGVSAAVPRHVLAAAAQSDWDARRRGVPEESRQQALTGLPPAVAREVVRAVEDVVAAYGVD